jgi:hypothetical protein
MRGRSALRAHMPMTDDNRLDKVSERIEQVVEQVGALRAEVRGGNAALRTEMIDRDASLLKWLLAFFVAQTAALGALMAAFR